MTSITFHPNALNFSPSGALFMTSFVVPEICSPLRSTVAQRLSKPYCAAAIIAS